jgi:hypothetical protein
MEAETSSLLMLDQSRVIPIREGKRDYTFYFRRILQADWVRYFDGLYLSSRSEGVAQMNITDYSTAAIELFESTLTKVVGYSRELTTLEDFRKVLPRISVPVSFMLRSVAISEAEDDDKPLDCDSIETRLDAHWSQTTDVGKVAKYPGLVHRFRPPNVEQRKRYMRGGAVSKVGGTRKGSLTVYSLKYKLLMQLYDELILSVEGYGVAGKPLEGAEQIQREMDGYHKAEAAVQLFITREDEPDAAAIEAA